MSDPDAPPLDGAAMLAALERHDVAFVAVGQLAAQWQGAEHVTRDFDICPAWHAENLGRVASVLRELGARLKVPDGPVAGVEVPIDGAFSASPGSQYLAHRRGRS